MPKLTPSLWFDNQAEEAALFYISIFQNSKIVAVDRYPEGPYGQAGKVMTVTLQLDGQEMTFLNGGPVFKLNEAFSFVVRCKTQEEIDYYWGKLLEGGGLPVQCGWLKDRYGVSWQVVPEILFELFRNPDPHVAKQVNEAMLGMIKFDIAGLQAAARGL
jgi:predicted 3-demethylubiquinone-9 3-methyltransferase (glyoxalase superfamily)